MVAAVVADDGAAVELPAHGAAQPGRHLAVVAELHVGVVHEVLAGHRGGREHVAVGAAVGHHLGLGAAAVGVLVAGLALVPVAGGGLAGLVGGAGGVEILGVEVALVEAGAGGHVQAGRELVGNRERVGLQAGIAAQRAGRGPQLANGAVAEHPASQAQALLLAVGAGAHAVQLPLAGEVGGPGLQLVGPVGGGEGLGNDVNDAAYGVGPVEGGPGPAHYLYLLNLRGCDGQVGGKVARERVVEPHAVEQKQHLIKGAAAQRHVGLGAEAAAALHLQRGHEAQQVVERVDGVAQQAGPGDDRNGTARLPRRLGKPGRKDHHLAQAARAVGRGHLG